MCGVDLDDAETRGERPRRRRGEQTPHAVELRLVGLVHLGPVRLVPEPFARRLTDLVPDGRYVEVPTPHALTYDRPRTLAHLVRAGDAPGGERVESG